MIFERFLKVPHRNIYSSLRRCTWCGIAGVAVTSQPAMANPSLALNYLDQVLEASDARRNITNRTLNLETDFSVGLASGSEETWLTPAAGMESGLSKFFEYALMYGPAEVTVGDYVDAHKAARQSVTLKFSTMPNFTWPARIDMVKEDGAWEIVDMRLLTRKPVSPAASPEAVLRSYLNNLKKFSVLIRDGDENQPQIRYLQKSWGRGGGYIAYPQGCPSETQLERACDILITEHMPVFLKSIVGDRERRYGMANIVADTATPTAELTISQERRTYSQQDRWKLSMTKHPRYGWEISSIESFEIPDEMPTEPTANASASLEMVNQVLELNLGPERPGFMDFAATKVLNDSTEEFYVRGRTGKKARTAIFMTGHNATMGGAATWVVEPLNDYQFDVKVSSPEASEQTLRITIIDEGGHPKISKAEFK